MDKEMIHFRFEVAGEAQFSRKIQSLQGLVTDMTPAWQKIAADFYAGEKERFGGGQWQALTPKYLKWKADHNLSTRILVSTGELEASLTSPTAAGAIYEMRPMSLMIGTGVRTDNGKFNLGMIHQVGTRYTPQREVIRITDEQRKTWSSAMASGVRKAMKAAAQKP